MVQLCLLICTSSARRLKFPGQKAGAECTHLSFGAILMDSEIAPLRRSPSILGARAMAASDVEARLRRDVLDAGQVNGLKVRAMIKALIKLAGYRVVYVCDWGTYERRYGDFEYYTSYPITRDMKVAPPWAEKQIVRTR